MRSYLRRCGVAWLPVVVLAVLFAVGVAGLSTVKPAQAQAPGPVVCRAVIILDRSGSVALQMPTMKAQVKSLFDVGGLYEDRIQLAYWSFAYAYTNTYNAPNHGYVSSFGRNTGFDASIDSLRSLGSTNYEHAFAHHNGVQNAYTADVANSADVMVFVTDGAPQPDSSKYPAREAVLKYKARGTDVIGGIVGSDTPRRALNYVINGNESNNTDTFYIRSNYSDLGDRLKEWVQAKCYPRGTWRKVLSSHKRNSW